MAATNLVIVDTSAGAGVAIRERRLELGISQSELARRIGVDPTLISRIERGHRAINMRYAGRLAEVLGWNVVKRAIAASDAP